MTRATLNLVGRWMLGVGLVLWLIVFLHQVWINLP
jgi:hypothetical protein